MVGRPGAAGAGGFGNAQHRPGTCADPGDLAAGPGVEVPCPDIPAKGGDKGRQHNGTLQTSHRSEGRSGQSTAHQAAGAVSLCLDTIGPGQNAPGQHETEPSCTAAQYDALGIRGWDLRDTM